MINQNFRIYGGEINEKINKQQILLINFAPLARL